MALRREATARDRAVEAAVAEAVANAGRGRDQQVRTCTVGTHTLGTCSGRRHWHQRWHLRWRHRHHAYLRRNLRCMSTFAIGLLLVCDSQRAVGKYTIWCYNPFVVFVFVFSNLDLVIGF